jgi:hypothetical protein
MQKAIILHFCCFKTLKLKEVRMVGLEPMAFFQLKETLVKEMAFLALLMKYFRRIL